MAMSVAPLMGQTVTYLRTYDMNNYVPPDVSVEFLGSVERVSYGYYLAGAFVEVINPTPLMAETAAVVFKVDEDGNVIPGSIYKVAGITFTDVRDASGNYLLTGLTLDPDTSGVVMEMDMLGNVVWARKLSINMSNSSPDTRDKVIEGLPLSSGGYAFVGESADNVSSFDAVVFKTDATGNLLWYRFLGGTSPYGDKARDLAEISGGNLAVAGISGGFIGQYDGFLSVLDGATGNVLWSKVYGTFDGEYIFAMKPTPDGGFILVGDRMVGADTNVLVVKTDGSGNLQWAYEYGDASSKELGRGVAVVPDGYVISGTRGSSILLFKINTSGDVVWAKTYNGSGTNAGSEVVPGVDGGFALVGIWNAGLSQDAALVKTLDDGRVLTTGGGTCASVSDIALNRVPVFLTVQTPASFTLSRTLTLLSYSPTSSPTSLAPGDICPLGGEYDLSVEELSRGIGGMEGAFTVDGRRAERVSRDRVYILKGKTGYRRVIKR